MSKTIGILAECLFQYDGVTDLAGGGERWFVDFIHLLHKLGYKTKCYQFSYQKFAKWYNNDIWITGLGNIVSNNINECYFNGLNEFYDLTKDCDGIFLLSMNLSFMPTQKPLLIVSHGLMFDGIMPGLQYKPIDRLEMYKRWIRNATHTISVDSNSIKVMQTYFHKNVSKMTYIPNYTDLCIFKPTIKTDTSTFNIIFPRRLQWCRGYTTMMAATDILLEKYMDIIITFCGRGNEQEEKYFASWHKNKPQDRVKHISYEMKDMWKAYQNMDCACIPTIMAEGTSLSCLEAQASGVVPIVTPVGGLTDLVFDKFNGLIVKADDTWDLEKSNPASLVEGIEYLYHNRDKLAEMRENAINVSKTFSKERWEKDVSKVIKEVYGESNE